MPSYIDFLDKVESCWLKREQGENIFPMGCEPSIIDHLEHEDFEISLDTANLLGKLPWGPQENELIAFLYIDISQKIQSDEPEAILERLHKTVNIFKNRCEEADILAPSFIKHQFSKAKINKEKTQWSSYLEIEFQGKSNKVPVKISLKSCVYNATTLKLQIGDTGNGDIFDIVIEHQKGTIGDIIITPRKDNTTFLEENFHNKAIDKCLRDDKIIKKNVVFSWQAKLYYYAKMFTPYSDLMRFKLFFPEIPKIIREVEDTKALKIVNSLRTTRPTQKSLITSKDLLQLPPSLQTRVENLQKLLETAAPLSENSTSESGHYLREMQSKYLPHTIQVYVGLDAKNKNLQAAEILDKSLNELENIVTRSLSILQNETSNGTALSVNYEFLKDLSQHIGTNSSPSDIRR